MAPTNWLMLSAMSPISSFPITATRAVRSQSLAMPRIAPCISEMDFRIPLATRLIPVSMANVTPKSSAAATMSIVRDEASIVEREAARQRASGVPSILQAKRKCASPRIVAVITSDEAAAAERAAE